ncbi:MAG: DUF4350 domain-containing protein [Bacteroidales bacterium]|jgi:unsaturated rhamnogalacturonyl hydrolase
MIYHKFLNNKYLSFFLLSALVTFQSLSAQPVIGLDNWFNRETNPATGKPYHYLWTDTAVTGYSRWGEIFKAKGARLATVGKPAAAVLSKLDVYIIVDPDTTTESESPNYIMPDDIKAIVEWVRSGGVLAIFANDAPNCEFTHLNQLAEQFGITFNHVTLHRVAGTNFETGASTDLPPHPLFNGVSKIFIKEISDVNLSGTAKAILTENGNILIAENLFGMGYVFAIGDPWLYNEYIDHERLPQSFDNRKAAENLTGILLGHAKKKK